jgi:ADP-ribose pyrophosphatase YjhB (NUDIX family)
MSLREIPLGGICLSTFLVIRDKSGRVLMGKIDPAAPWDHLGALDTPRIELYRNGWMLPSSHLIVRESPQDGASRIAKEQLEIVDLSISEPKVVSEVYPPRAFPDLDEHWDLEFIFFAQTEEENLPSKTKAFKELRLLDPTALGRSDVARSHEDILHSAGIELL